MLSSDNAGSGMDIIRRYNGNYNVRLVTMSRKKYISRGRKASNDVTGRPRYITLLHHHYITTTSPLHLQLHLQLHHQLHLPTTSPTTSTTSPTTSRLHHLLHLPTASSNCTLQLHLLLHHQLHLQLHPQLHHLAASPNYISNYIVHCIP